MRVHMFHIIVQTHNNLIYYSFIEEETFEKRYFDKIMAPNLTEFCETVAARRVIYVNVMKRILYATLCIRWSTKLCNMC